MGGIVMANVVFNRIEDSTLLDNIPVIDGSFYVTGDGKTFIDYDEERLPVGGTPDTAMSDRSGNAVENRVVKGYIDNAVSHLVVLTTDGDAVPTGKIIDGKVEYVKRYSIPITKSGNQAHGEKELGFNLSNVLITNIESTITSNSNNVFNLDTANYNAGYNYIYLNNDSNKIMINCNSGNYSELCYANVYYINR
jgi:hypothetical protein